MPIRTPKPDEDEKVASGYNLASKKGQQEAVAALRSLLAAGSTDYECTQELGITLLQLGRLKQKLFTDELSTVQAETAAETWVRYKLRLEASIHDLDAIINATRPSVENGDASPPSASALNAAVGAIKARISLVDQILLKGQELGVIAQRAPDTKDRSSLPSEIPALEKLVKEAEQNIELLVAKYGSTDIADIPQMTDEEVYLEMPEDHPAKVH